MAWTQEDLDKLDDEIRKVQTIKATAFGDQSTTFRDLDELLKLRAVMAARINTTRLGATSKGTTC